MDDLGSSRRTKKWDDSTFFQANYIVIAVFNFVLFCLTIYGNHKLNTDSNHADYYYDNWNALKFDLAVACLTWLFLAYGIIRRLRSNWLPQYITSIGKWDQVIADGVIWILQLSAAIDQTVFITTYFHCDVECRRLNSGSTSRNISYTVFAWLLWAAWTPQLIWSSYTSRVGGRDL